MCGLVGDWRWKMGLSHTYMWQLRIGRDLSAAEVLTEEWWVPASHWDPQPRDQVPGKVIISRANLKIGTASDLSQWDRGLQETQTFLCTDSLTHRHSSWAPVKKQQLVRHQRHMRRDWIVWLQGESCLPLFLCWSHTLPFFPVQLAEIGGEAGGRGGKTESALSWRTPLAAP